MMKKWIVLLFILSMILKLNAQTGIAITVIVAPAPGAAITMDSQLWNILLANDGITTYQNDHQGTMTIKSSAFKNYRVDFLSQNLGCLLNKARTIQPITSKRQPLQAATLAQLEPPLLLLGTYNLLALRVCNSIKKHIKMVLNSISESRWILLQGSFTNPDSTATF